MFNYLRVGCSQPMLLEIAIRILITLTKVLLLACLLFVLAGLLLPHKYHLKQQKTFLTVEAQQLSSLFDLQAWSQLMRLNRVKGTKDILISIPSTGVGAHATVQHQFGKAEITITKKDAHGIDFSLLINNEHTAAGQLTLTPRNDSITVHWHVTGVIHSTIFGGYMALYMEYYIHQLMISAFNNLQTELKLRAST
ncbi:hypothetical protein [Pseudoalteromonas sp. MMG022]|uniref:hypothetical protein n=1 Tax=Pseudoalteromonas sp. MMG022 TaxID=2909978 RepID=UPI001F285F60|nr:hypothetical protein [Pseudoalteromonas sp. MMG022]MCF6434999.1 hypothetical protein [Pseudoalteromonas sp. MMG022]